MTQEETKVDSNSTPNREKRNHSTSGMKHLLKGISINDTKRFHFLAILFLIFLLLCLFNRQILNYASSFLGALTLFAVLRTPMRVLTIRYHWRRSIASGLLTILAIILFLIPLGGIVAILLDLFSTTSFNFADLWEEARKWNGVIYERFQVNLLSIDTVKNLSSMGQSVLSWLFSNLTSMAVNSILMIFLLYYMLYQRVSFESAIRELLPFTKENKEILVTESKRIIVANAISIPVLAIIQAVFAYIGYSYLGVSNPLFVAVLTAFSTIIPIAGTMIVYIPITIYFALDAEWGKAIIMLLYGFIIIGGVDNVVRFLLQKWIADIHPLITVFGVLFGMAIFGFWGVIFGPLLLSLFVLFLNMYRHDYVPGSTAIPRVTSAVKERDTSRELKEKIHSLRDKKESKTKEVKRDE